MSRVTKHVIKVTILAPTGETLDGKSLSRIAYEIDEGGWLGLTEHESSEPVPDDQISTEAAALGNDGEFFNDLLEGDEQ